MELREHISYRGIMGLPPPSDPRAILQRESVVRDIYDKLTQPDITAIALTGIGGIGKSTLAALVVRYAEEQRLAGNGPFTDKPLWLRLDPSVTMADLVGNLFEAFGKPIPDLSNLSPQNQAVELFNALDTVNKPRLVVLDQFENLLNDQGHVQPDRPGVGEWLDAISSQKCTCHILLTSRTRPQGTREYSPSYMREYLVGGLAEVEGIELLRKWGVQGTEEEFRTAVRRCAGHALSLILLASLLVKQNLSLGTLFKEPVYDQLWIGDIAHKLLDYIFTKQLDQMQRKLLLAFSVYREPVPLAAAQFNMQLHDEVSAEQMITALAALLNQHLIQASDQGNYQLHPIIADYAQGHFADDDERANRQAMLAAHAKAGQYYQQRATQAGTPREKRRRIIDVDDLIEAVWHYCQAGLWGEAYDLMEQEELFADLEQWSGFTILAELCQWLLPGNVWQPGQAQAANIYSYLARSYSALGRKDEALREYEKALQIYKEVPDPRSEADILDNLGNIYADLGQQNQNMDHYQQALDYYQQALIIRQRIGDHLTEGRRLNNLGTICSNLGNWQKARDYYRQALIFHRKAKDRRGEGMTLHNLGTAYKAEDQIQNALGAYQHALKIFQDEGDRLNEGITLWYVGLLFLKQLHYENALAGLLLAKQIFTEVESPNQEQVQKDIVALAQIVGEKQFVALLASVEPKAQQIVEQVLHSSDLQEAGLTAETDSVPTHLDRPAQVDELGRKSFAEALASRIRGMQHEKNKAPAFMLHIHGSWGSGKTSLLNFLSEELKQGDTSSPWVVVNFNAWMHQRLSSPWWWLMNAVFQQSARQLWEIDRGKSIQLRLREFGWRFIRAGWPPYLLTLLVLALVLWMIRVNSFFGLLDFGTDQAAVDASKIAVTPLADAAKSVSAIIALIITVWGLIFGLSRSLLQGSERTAKVLLESTSDPMKAITDHFKNLVDSIGHPVAIFIDDIDRCQGSYIVELLEGIQTLFIEAAVTYVIAADQRWVSASYDKAYEAFASTFEEPGRPLGSLFLEKAFQLSTSVPPISQKVQAEYWQHLLQANQTNYRERLNKAQAAAEERLRAKYTEKEILDEVMRVSKSNDIIGELAIRQAAVKRLAASDVEEATEHDLKKFATLLDPNPRAMKRLVNTYGTQRAIATLAGIDVGMKQLALWTIIVLRWPRLAEYLEHHPKMVRYIAEPLSADEKLPDDIPEDLRKLFADERVCRVVRGKEVGISLQEDLIRACAYLRASDSSTR